MNLRKVMTRHRRSILSCLMLMALHSSIGWVRCAVDFNREVRPILSDNCFQCHGPDEKARKGKFRLDTKEGAFRIKDGKPAIIPGNSAESELVRRLTTTNADDLMPPTESDRKLTATQISTLRRWVEEGAKWETHWAFATPQRPQVPALRGKHSVRNPVDNFILERLEKEGVTPAPEARREVLLRRLTLDLTGLPPTQAELDAFLSDQASDAYERQVDRLLNSPRYGERMAVEWLDIARYADTHGYQMDRFRAVWPYRDWVIKAFNQNLPYDQFVTWQIAGDLLPNATKDQRLATAFNRLHCQNEEGGIVEEEYRVAYVVDRVNTFATAFLGLTTECSRCHDHKYDPLSMRDFYSLSSFFQNIDESGQTVYFGEVMPVPTMLLSTDEQDAQLARLREQISTKERQVPNLRSQAGTAFAQWLDTGRAASASTTPQRAPTIAELRGLVAYLSFDEIVTNKVTNLANATKPASTVESPKLVASRNGQAAELTGENGFTLPGVGHFTRTDAFSIGMWLRTPVHSPRFVVAHHSRAPVDAGSRGYELLLESGRVALGLHHAWPGNSLKVSTRQTLATNEWTHVAFAYDGSSRAAGVRIFINGRLADTEVIRDGLIKDITYESGEPDLAIGHRFRDSGFRGGVVDDFMVFNRALTLLEVTHIAGLPDYTQAWNTDPASLTAEQRDGLLDYFVANSYAPAQRFLENLQTLRREQSKLINPIPELMVMQEMAEPKPAFVLKRGAYDAPGDRVSANTPAVMPPFPTGQPTNRLGLARWLVAPENPLMARVTVNRAWQMMFGKGIVETPDNFGSQGATPTHPELLDWLAREFSDTGWDMKRLLKLIATSATYRQSSHASADLLARDPGNQSLARGPTRRLTAEMLRDQALAASSLLVERLGGPSVKPYQPEGLWEEIAMGRPRYGQGHGDDLHRRSLYTFWKRTVPHPAMMTFDSTERNTCAVRRQDTSTPLQALTLLNDTQFIEAARLLAERMFKEGGSSLEDQLAWAFRTVTSRRPAAREIAVLRKLYDDQRELFAADPSAAARLVTVGEAVNDPSIALENLAAGTVLAKAIMNHDEAIMRR